MTKEELMANMISELQSELNGYHDCPDPEVARWQMEIFDISKRFFEKVTNEKITIKNWIVAVDAKGDI